MAFNPTRKQVVPTRDASRGRGPQDHSVQPRTPESMSLCKMHCRRRVRRMETCPGCCRTGNGLIKTFNLLLVTV